MTVLPYRSFTAPMMSSGLPQSGLSHSGVRISPSRPEVRKADPSLSFQVVAPGSRFFDVIVATEAALFDPAEAHRRTAKNFRSSRQDFQGQPVEIEIGFYLVPRAFLRDVISIDPRPTRIYYVAVAYATAEGADAQFSVPPDRMSRDAPSVSLASDLNPLSLSKVLGMAVERLGAVNGQGRVMSAMALSSDRHLPAEIGGLPLVRRPAPSTMPPTSPQPVQPAPVADGSIWQPRVAATPPAVAMPQPPPQMVPPAPQNGTPMPPPQGSAGFVDDDYRHTQKAPASRFRDVDAARAMQAGAGFDYDDGFGAPPAPAPGSSAVTPAPIPPLDAAPQPPATPPPRAPAIPPKDQPSGAQGADLVALVIAEGAGGRYDALSLDGGFRGRFGTAHPYYQRAHDGLAFGPHQAGQDSGELGELLSQMLGADPAAFGQIFSPDAAALVATTTAAGPSGLEVEGGRSARVQPVGGQDLWADPWVDRFRAAARHPAFQRVIDAHIAARRMDPLRPVAAALGLHTPRGLAMLTAAAIHLGVDGAVALARAAVNPFDAPARVGAVLGALGYSDLAAFQTAHRLQVADYITMETHFALITALRDLGPDSPVEVADAEAAMDSLVTSQGPGPVGDALLKLRVTDTLTDAVTGV